MSSLKTWAYENSQYVRDRVCVYIYKEKTATYVISASPFFAVLIDIFLKQVSALYRDASIGNAINIVMVRLMLLENESVEVKQRDFSDYS